MKLLLFEIKKIIFTKLTILFGVFVIILAVIMPITYVSRYRMDNMSHKNLTVKDIAKKYKEYKDLKVNYNNVEMLYSEDAFQNDLPYNSFYDYLPQKFNLTYDAICYQKTGNLIHGGVIIQALIEQPYQVHSLDTIHKKLAELEKAQKQESYSYKNYTKQLNMMEKVSEPKFIYQPFWEMYDVFNMIATLVIAVALCFLIAPVFAQEYTSKAYMIIASSYFGKRRIVSSKILACVVIGCIVVLINHLMMAIIYLGMGGFYNANELLNSLSIYYAYAPYHITIGHYFLIRIFIQILSVTALVNMLCYFSLLFRSTLVSSAAGLILVFSGFIFDFIIGKKSVISYFSLTYGFNTGEIFKYYVSFPLFGKPVLYPYVFIIFIIAFIAIFYILVHLKYAKGKCNIVK